MNDTRTPQMGAQIFDAQQLMAVAGANKSVTGRGRCLFDYGTKHRPARFIICQQFAEVMKLINKGLFEYVPQGKSPRKKPEVWAKLCGLEILDPDGWRESYNRIHGHKEWTDRITFAEFQRREMISTCQFWMDRDRYAKYREAKTWRDIV